MARACAAPATTPCRSRRSLVEATLGVPGAVARRANVGLVAAGASVQSRRPPRRSPQQRPEPGRENMQQSINLVSKGSISDCRASVGGTGRSAMRPAGVQERFSEAARVPSESMDRENGAGQVR